MKLVDVISSPNNEKKFFLFCTIVSKTITLEYALHRVDIHNLKIDIIIAISVSNYHTQKRAKFQFSASSFCCMFVRFRTCNAQIFQKIFRCVVFFERICSTKSCLKRSSSIQIEQLRKRLLVHPLFSGVVVNHVCLSTRESIFHVCYQP